MTITVLYDPLCGWCYGAGPAITALADAHGEAVELVPTGLFFGRAARTLDEGFAAYAWTADQRVAAMSGQPLTETYRKNVLVPGARLDSGPMTVALTAARARGVTLEPRLLASLQLARWRDGLDVADDAVVLARARTVDGLSDLSEGELADAREVAPSRVASGKALLAEVGARGVPTVIVHEQGRKRVVRQSALFAGREAVLAAVR